MMVMIITLSEMDVAAQATSGWDWMDGNNHETQLLLIKNHSTRWLDGKARHLLELMCQEMTGSTI